MAGGTTTLGIGRRIGTNLSIAVFAAQFVALDVILRGVAAYAREPRALLLGAASVALWYLLSTLRRRRAVRAALATIAASVLVTDVLFFRSYRTLIDAQVVSSALHSWSDVRPIALRMLPGTLLAIAVVTGLELQLLSRRPPRRPRRAPAAIVLLGAIGLAGSIREGTPDLRLAHSLTLLAGPPDASKGTSVAVPSLTSTRDRVPNVLFILTESVRASDYCSARAERCDVAPLVNALFPGRSPLLEMRSVSSYTAVSLSALITGRTQEGPRADILDAPNVFDFAKSIRQDGRAPYVVYWSAQLASVFERRDVRSAVDSFVTLETLVGHEVDDEDDEVDRGVDGLLAAHVERELPGLRSPYFILLHFAGTHAPYFVQDRDAPFQPSEREVAWSKMPGLLNAYRNSIHEQDKAIAAAIRAFRDHQGDSPWAVVFTSDHGEAFGEHGAIHHGQNLYDEQIHVPAWIATSEAALTHEQRRHLDEWRGGYATHLDLLPTLLDLYGVLDGFAMGPYRDKLVGRSLLRGIAKMSAPLPITNCTAMFPCPVNTWGVLDDDYALEAQLWDGDWNCTNLRTGQERLVEPRCQRLREASKAHFALLPNRRPNL